MSTLARGEGASAPSPWMERGWRNCSDIFIKGVIENAPRYLRCYKMGCNRLVTHGQVATGTCACGNRKVMACTGLTYPEALFLKLGWFPLVDWEREQIKPLFDLTGVRNFLYKHLG